MGKVEEKEWEVGKVNKGIKWYLVKGLCFCMGISCVVFVNRPIALYSVSTILNTDPLYHNVCAYFPQTSTARFLSYCKIIPAIHWELVLTFFQTSLTNQWVINLLGNWSSFSPGHTHRYSLNKLMYRCSHNPHSPLTSSAFYDWIIRVVQL